MFRRGVRALAAIASLGVGVTTLGLFPPHTSAALAFQLTPPPPPVPPPQVLYLREAGKDQLSRRNFRSSHSTRAEAEAELDDSSRFFSEDFARMRNVSFNGPDKNCLEVSVGEARVGGRVRVRPCSGMETQIFRTDLHALYGAPVMIWSGRPMNDGRPLCLRYGGAKGDVRVALCHPLYFEKDVGPVPDAQRWSLMFPNGPWRTELPKTLMPVQMRTHESLCVVPDHAGRTMRRATVEQCPPRFSDSAPSSWVVVGR